MSCRSRSPCNLEVKDCPAPVPKQRQAVDVSKWGVKNVCDVVGGVDYKGGTYVLNNHYFIFTNIIKIFLICYHYGLQSLLLGDLDSFKILFGPSNEPIYDYCCR